MCLISAVLAFKVAVQGAADASTIGVMPFVCSTYVKDVNKYSTSLAGPSSSLSFNSFTIHHVQFPVDSAVFKFCDPRPCIKQQAYTDIG